MKKLCELLGGSHLYGLNTPQSDIDRRGVFINTELNKVIGLDRFEHVDTKQEEDVFLFEFRHYLNLLRKTNTQVMEIIWAEPHHFTILEPDFQREVMAKRHLLCDTSKLFKSLKGYVFGERRLMNGERTGELGGKRREALDKYGYSYKNAVQCIRLLNCGTCFITNGFFPVNIREYSEPLADYLLDIKLNPQNHSKEQINRMVDGLEKEFDEAFNFRDDSKDYKFDMDLANWLCLRFYGEVVFDLIKDEKNSKFYRLSKNLG